VLKRFAGPKALAGFLSTLLERPTCWKACATEIGYRHALPNSHTPVDAVEGTEGYEPALIFPQERLIRLQEAEEI